MSAARSALGVLSGHTLVYLAGSLCAKLASILLLPIFTRPEYLDPGDYGILSLLNTTVALGLQLLGFQLDAAVTRHYFEDDDPDRRRRVVSTAFLALLGLTLAIAIPLALLSPWLAQHWLERDDLPAVLALVGAVLVSMVLTEVPLAALKAERRSTLVTGWLLLRLLVEIGLKIAFVVAFSLGVTGVMAGQALAGWVFVIGFGAFTLRRFGARFDRAILKSMIAFSAPMVVAGICQFALHNADRFMLKELASDAQLGLYEVGYQFGYAVTSVVLSAFLLIWYPFIFSQKDPAEQRRITGAAILHIPALILLLSLPIALLAPEIIALITSSDAFQPAWAFIPVILASYLFWGLFQVVQTPFYIHRETARLPRIVGTAALVNIGLNLLFIPTYAAMGAALATLCALLVLALLTLHGARRMEPVAVQWSRTLGPLAVAGVAGIALYVPAQDSAWWLPLRLLALLVGAAWMCGPYLRRDERDQVRALITSLAARVRGAGSA